MSVPPGEAVAAVLCILDAGPESNVLFGAPAVSIRQLESDLSLPPSSLDPYPLLPLFSPLCATFFPTPRRPVIRHSPDAAWLVFERLKSAEEGMRPLRLSGADGERKRERRRTRMEDLRRWSQASEASPGPSSRSSSSGSSSASAASRLSVDWSGSPARSTLPTSSPSPRGPTQVLDAATPPARRRPLLAVRTDISPTPRPTPLRLPLPPSRPLTAATKSDSGSTPAQTPVSSKRRFLRPLLLRGKRGADEGRVIDLPSLEPPASVSSRPTTPAPVRAIAPPPAELARVPREPSQSAAEPRTDWGAASNAAGEQIAQAQNGAMSVNEGASPHDEVRPLHEGTGGTGSASGRLEVEVDVRSAAPETFEWDDASSSADGDGQEEESSSRQGNDPDDEGDEPPSAASSSWADEPATPPPTQTWLEVTFDGLPFGPGVPALDLLGRARAQWRFVLAELVVLVGLAIVFQLLTG
ncbi:hypothetical protein Q5752_004395 [Cryptotrichosporon argae]